MKLHLKVLFDEHSHKFVTHPLIVNPMKVHLSMELIN